ncbi:MAG: SDR family oxidoreductase [SAR324 cluster bacterium]|nr:SDR family oxidoreductase [SAR324 cluster bacterium]
METLQEKHVVITGGGSGIGAAITDALAEKGTRITIMGRKLDRLQEKVKTIKQAFAVSVDVTDLDQVEQGFAKAVANHGTVDILINNAGNAISVPFHKMGLEDWNTMLAVNLNGVFNCTQACLPSMRKQKWGRIINIASTAGLKGYAYVSAYCAAKHGVIGLTRALALETALDGITVNAVCPGYTETALTEAAIENIFQKTNYTKAEVQMQLLQNNPQKRFVQPEEIANTVFWLCQHDSKSITGQAVPVAGGEVM